ncbi:MAG: UbiH/UbiF/VisC/COQ6 family ubiquinone biosynthesis hydroxylase [Alphaproteobacteria bacterium]|nr:UbiH/UbiF/VisC/COQ6 family ubiquinone biosynthesis hydroxylase [Alphaproteobacteria bacterium]
MPRKKKSDLIISGGGIAGLTLASLLGGAGLSVHLIDPAPPQPLKKTAPSSRTIALMESSVNIIKAAGAWDAVKSFSNPLKTMRIVDDSMGKKLQFEFSSRDIGQEQFGFNIPNSTLRAALYERVQEIKTVTLHCPGALADYTAGDNAVTVRLENGTSIEASLLVGADGRNSKVRAIAAIDCKIKDYQQSAITCVVGHTKPHNDTASEFHRPGGPLAFVPLKDQQSSIVWVERSEDAEDIMRLRKSEFIQLLQDRSNGILGALSLDSNPECWPLVSIKAKSLTAKRVALIAEAAHVISPITAQGLNLSLRDAAALAETIMDSMRVGLDPGAGTVLQKFEKRRHTDITTRVFGVNSMNSIVSTDAFFLKDLRRKGLSAVGNIRPLKKLAMQYGLAPEVDSGRLAKGQNL